MLFNKVTQAKFIKVAMKYFVKRFIVNIHFITSGSFIMNKYSF